MKKSDRLTKKKGVYIIWLLIMTFTAIVTARISGGKGWYLTVLVPFIIYQIITIIYEGYYYEKMCEKKNGEEYRKEQNGFLDEDMDNMIKLRYDKVIKQAYQRLENASDSNYIFKEEYDTYKKAYKLYVIQGITIMFFVWWFFVSWG